MKQMSAQTETTIDLRPWYREPWVWFIIALPAAAVVGCSITIWLAITRPDYLVVDDSEYQHIEAELHATPEPQAELQPARPGQINGDG